MDRYTTLAAEQLVDQKKHIGWKQLALEPPWTFFQTYELKRGFLDGPEGLAIAHMAALYNFLKYAKAKNMSPRRTHWSLSISIPAPRRPSPSGNRSTLHGSSPPRALAAD